MRNFAIFWNLLSRSDKNRMSNCNIRETAGLRLHEQITVIMGGMIASINDLPMCLGSYVLTFTPSYAICHRSYIARCTFLCSINIGGRGLRNKNVLNMIKASYELKKGLF